MSVLTTLPERALQLATQVGGGIKDAVPDRAIKWIETGAALGVLKTGTRVASKFVRRNPVVAVAAAAGAGLIWYAAHRKAKQNGVIEGNATRIEAKRENGAGARKRGTAQRSRRAKPVNTDS